MNQTEGLVKRRNVAKDSDGTSNSRENENDDMKVEFDDVEGDSKDTRLTLMEEVLLLGLKDKEVKLNIFYFAVIFDGK